MWLLPRLVVQWHPTPHLLADPLFLAQALGLYNTLYHFIYWAEGRSLWDVYWMNSCFEQLFPEPWNKSLFIYVDCAACRPSPVAVSRGSSRVAADWPLTAVASRRRAQALGGAGLVAVACWPSCSVTCGLFLDQGSNPCLICWQVDS